MINLTAAAEADIGLVRTANEDSVFARVHYFGKQPVGLFAVCDGMGGHMGGEYASYWALEAIKHELADIFSLDDPRDTILLSRKNVEKDLDHPNSLSLEQMAQIDLEARIGVAVQKANQVVHEYSQRRPEKAAYAGSTITMAVVLGNQAVIANAGDSRTYLLRDHQLRQVTRDHSLVAGMVTTGQISPDEIYDHPQRNVIYRYLGQKSLQPDIFHEPLRPGDYLLLCSDGLWEMVRDERRLVEVIENSKTALEAGRELIKAANAAGGEDNIGVVVVKISRSLRQRTGNLEAVW
jgi:serine/threonine protein phosphatase PrpC